MQQDTTASSEKKTLIVELWGMGDAVIMSSILQTLRPTGRQIYVLCRPLTRELLRPTYPEVTFITFRAPWTAFRKKYHVWKWPWLRIWQIVARLRREEFDEALSVRPDLRDHLLMFLSRARIRCGFPQAGIDILLNASVLPSKHLRHKVEDWHALAQHLLKVDAPVALPRVTPAAHSWEEFPSLDKVSLPILVVHCGAGQAVRRWPVEYYRHLLRCLRKRYGFHLVIIPDDDGFGSQLKEYADTLLTQLSLAGLVRVLSKASLFLGNDSGPGHLAAAVGVPTVSFFGPQHPELFIPYGAHNLAVTRDLCEFRPCSDYCRFPQPYCLTALRPEEVVTEVTGHLDELAASGLWAASNREDQRLAAVGDQGPALREASPHV